MLDDIRLASSVARLEPRIDPAQGAKPRDIVNVISLSVESHATLFPKKSFGKYRLPDHGDAFPN